jgi:hypothetical protein
VARCRLNRRVVGLVLLMDLERLAKSHFGRYFAIAVGHALAMFFEKFGELGLRHAAVRGLERLPNFFAASKSSGIIAPRLMAEKIWLSGFFAMFSWICAVS